MAKNGRHPLQELREAVGLGKEEFAGRIGCTRAFIAMVESQRPATNLGRATVLSIVDVFRDDLNRLGITAEDLLRGTRERVTDGGEAGEAVA